MDRSRPGPRRNGRFLSRDRRGKTWLSLQDKDYAQFYKRWSGGVHEVDDHWRILKGMGPGPKGRIRTSLLSTGDNSNGACLVAPLRRANGIHCKVHGAP